MIPHSRFKQRWPYYAVGAGLAPGVYTSWSACKQNTHRVSGCKYKGFKSWDAAMDYVRRHFKILRRRPQTPTQTSSGSSNPKIFREHDIHYENTQVLAAHLIRLVVSLKFLPSVIYLTMTYIVPRQVASRLLRAMGCGIDGDWNQLRLLCATLSPASTRDLFKALTTLAATPPPLYRQDNHPCHLLSTATSVETTPEAPNATTTTQYVDRNPGQTFAG